jgi:hypothetical protein
MIAHNLVEPIVAPSHVLFSTISRRVSGMLDGDLFGPGVRAMYSRGGSSNASVSLSGVARGLNIDPAVA